MVDIVPVAALLISLASLAVAAYSFYYARRTYHASHDPIVDINVSMAPGGLMNGKPILPERLGLDMTNTGKGDARFLHPFSATLANGQWSVGFFKNAVVAALRAGTDGTVGLEHVLEAEMPAGETELVIVVAFKDVLNKVSRTTAHFSYNTDNGYWNRDGESRIFSTSRGLRLALRKWMGKDAEELANAVDSWTRTAS